MSGFENKIVFCDGEKLQPSSSDSINRMKTLATDVSRINYTGDPEGNIAANPSSLCHDPSSGNIYFKQTGTGNTGWVLIASSASDLHAARFIVSAGGTSDGANFTTIAAALAAAVIATGSQTIFLQPGVYTEDLTLVAGINLTAFDCDALTPNVTLNGKMTANITGSVSFSGINFLNSSDNVLEISGAGACQFNFTECFINVSGTDKAIINTNSSAIVSISSCRGNISGTNAYFAMTGGGVQILDSFFSNSVINQTQNIFDNCTFDLESSTFDSPILSTDTGGDVSIKHSTMILLDTTLISTSGGPNTDLVIFNSHIDSNNAAAIDIGAGSTMTICNTSVGSTATDAITGAGVLLYTPISFTKSSSNVTVSTQTPLAFGPEINNSTILHAANNLGDVADQNTSLANVMPPTPAKGTVVVFDGTDWVNLPVGSDGKVFTANSGAPEGVDWETPGSGGAATVVSVAMAADTSMTQNTLSDVIYDTVLIDTASGFAAGVYTCPNTGNLQINVASQFVSTAGFVNCDLFVNKNSGTYQFHGVSFVTIDDPLRVSLCASIIIPVTAGDTLKISIFSQTSGATNYTAVGISNGYYNTFSAVYV